MGFFPLSGIPEIEFRAQVTLQGNMSEDISDVEHAAVFLISVNLFIGTRLRQQGLVLTPLKRLWITQ